MPIVVLQKQHYHVHCTYHAYMYNVQYSIKIYMSIKRSVVSHHFQHHKITLFRNEFFNSPRPLYMDRFVFLVLVLTLNFSAAILGVIFMPSDFPSFLLAVFLINLLAYFAYYVLMKFINGEVGPFI